jgi:diguanylate cyclase (GGDEF)-like protein
MLFLLPPALIPLAVTVSLCAATLPDMVAGRADRERLVTAVGDSGYALAPALVLVALGRPDGFGDWPLLVAALAAQSLLDAALSIAREWIGRGVRPALQLSVMGTVYGVDALLAPLALVIAVEATREPLAVLAVLPLGLLLAAVVRDRNRRIDEAAGRLDEVARVHDRMNVAIQRVGRALGDSLDRSAMLEVALGTTVDAVGAAAGRARLAGYDARTFEAIPHQPGAAEAAALLAAEQTAREGHAMASKYVDGWWAIGRPLIAGGGAPVGAIAVCRSTGEFSLDEESLFGYLATQTAAAIESIELHERLREQITRDELTGLASHRRFHELLEVEVEAAHRDHSPLSVLLIDVDRFRRVNAALGHAAGDEILRAIGTVVRERCRVTDEPARYGGQRLAVALAHTELDDAWLAAEHIRTGIAALEIPAGDDFVHVTASIGIAELSHRVPSREALIFAAEAALDEAKEAGRNRSVGFRGPYHIRAS